MRPFFNDGVAIFDDNGRLVELTVQPIPEEITKLWDRGKAIGYGCSIG